MKGLLIKLIKFCDNQGNGAIHASVGWMIIFFSEKPMPIIHYI